MGSLFSHAKERSSRTRKEFRHDVKAQLHMNALVLSESQKVLLRKTWKYLEVDMNNIGKMVLLRIFERKPSIKDYFPFRKYKGERLLAHHTFINHSYRWVGCMQ